MSRTLITGFVFTAVTLLAVLIITGIGVKSDGFNIAQTAKASETDITAQAREKYEKELQQLLTERRQLLSNVVDSMKIFLESGRIGLDEYMRANVALLRADMDLCKTKDERLEILQKIVQLHRECEAWIARRAAEGRATEADVKKAKVGTLEAQIELLREKLKGQSAE
jgi:hypothetical protein